MFFFLHFTLFLLFFFISALFKIWKTFEFFYLVLINNTTNDTWEYTVIWHIFWSPHAQHDVVVVLSLWNILIFKQMKLLNVTLQNITATKNPFCPHFVSWECEKSPNKDNWARKMPCAGLISRGEETGKQLHKTVLLANAIGQLCK